MTGYNQGQQGLNVQKKRAAVFWRAFFVLVVFCFSGCRNFSERLTGSRNRCVVGLSPLQARCCAPGQEVIGGHCSGKPLQCPSEFRGSTEGRKGCVLKSVPLWVPPGEYVVGPNDWESENVGYVRGHVDGFWLDSTEVSWERYYRCVVSGKCALHTESQGAYEPGQPVTGIDVLEAKAFCSWSKGRLPRVTEWLRATATEKSYRFPWGQTGLVCRRAVFGLVNGPCAEGGTEPEIVGSRPDGRSTTGFFDLVGNVGEMVETISLSVEVRGGSFRSDHAAVLKSWSVEPYRGPRDDIGFRCAYDADPRLFSGG